MVGEGDYDYRFSEDDGEWWSWLQMIALLCHEHMKQVVEGPDGRSGGLVSCEVSMRETWLFTDTNTDGRFPNVMSVCGCCLDAYRHLLFDFAVTRQDGSVVRLHPNWSSAIVDAFGLADHDEQMERPRAGLCGSTRDLLHFDLDKLKQRCGEDVLTHPSATASPPPLPFKAPPPGNQRWHRAPPLPFKAPPPDPRWLASPAAGGPGINQLIRQV